MDKGLQLRRYFASGYRLIPLLQALKRRQELFKTYDLPNELGDARINSVSILQATTFGFILSSNKKIGITIGKGKASDIRIKL